MDLGESLKTSFLIPPKNNVQTLIEEELERLRNKLSELDPNGTATPADSISLSHEDKYAPPPSLFQPTISYKKRIAPPKPVCICDVMW